MYGIVVLSLISFRLLRLQIRAVFDEDTLYTIIAVIGFVSIGAMLLSPVGLFFTIRAIRRQEGTRFQRIFHLFVHSVVFLLFMAIVLIFFSDTLSIFRESP